MLEELIKMVTHQGQSDVVQNSAVPDQFNNEIIGEAGSSIFNGLQGMLANGGLSQILRLLNGAGGNSGGGIGGLLNNPIVQQIIQSFAGKLTNQYNLSPAVAQNVGASLIPQVLGNFAQRVGDPTDSSIDMNAVISSLTGGNTGGADFNSLAAKLGGMGGDVDGDGDVDFQDIIASVSGAAKQEQSSGNNIMDMIGGLLR